MAEELRLKTNHNPSIFNKDMLLWGLLGALLPGGPIVWGIGAAVGAIIGGVVGKNRLEKENQEGKKVGEPRFWNKKTLIGGLLGSEIGSWLGVLAGGAIIVAGFVAAGIDPSVASGHMTRKMTEIVLDKAPAYLLAGAGTMIASWIGGTVIGAWIGGKSGKKDMEREYEEAKQQQIVQHISQNVSPEVGQAIEYTMANNKDWGKKMLEDKLLAAAQQPGR